jgi:UDP-2,3-diacylglucosamine pyrophosphatase LpxH
MGAWGHEYMTILNGVVNTRRERRDQSPVDFASAMKLAVKRVIKKSTSYEGALIAHAKELGYDGVICGHVHRPSVEDHGGFLYANSGDWVEHCTAFCEHLDGTFELVDWASLRPQPKTKIPADLTEWPVSPAY